MSDFVDKLNSLVSLEMAGDTVHDPAKMSDMLEGLASALGFSAALASGGDPARISHLLEGMTAYVFEIATERAPLAKMITSAKAMKR